MPPVHILLISSDPSTLPVVRKSLVYSLAGAVLEHVPSRREAWAYLRREPPYGSAPSPAAVVLDLPLRDSRGLELLMELKVGLTAHIPVVVLTASREESTAIRSLSLPAVSVARRLPDPELMSGVLFNLLSLWVRPPAPGREPGAASESAAG